MSEIIILTQTNIRIDQYLTSIFPYSRNFFHHIIERGGIKISRDASIMRPQDTSITIPIKKSYKLKAWDTIHIDSLKRYIDGTILQEAPCPNIPIIHETPHYLIINKPKGVLSHPNSIRDIASPSVTGRLYHTYKDLPSVGNFIRAWLIHRLDKETNWLMIIAKTEQGLAHFKHLFQQKSEADTIQAKEAVPLKKYYRATCHITPTGKEFLQTIPSSWVFSKDPGFKNSKNQNPATRSSQLASLPFPTVYYIIKDVIPNTPYPVIKQGITKILSLQIPLYPDSSIVTFELEILTGRTHQIRYHLSSLGLPIIGDYLYGDKSLDQKLPSPSSAISAPSKNLNTSEYSEHSAKSLSSPPLQLTAYQLTFQDLEGTMQTFVLQD